MIRPNKTHEPVFKKAAGKTGSFSFRFSGCLLLSPVMGGVKQPESPRVLHGKEALTNDGTDHHKKEVIMKLKTQVFFAMATAIVMAALTALLLLSGYIRVLIWKQGHYSLLLRLLTGMVDTLWTMVVVVAAYYFAASLTAIKYYSRQTPVLVVLIVIALISLEHLRGNVHPAGPQALIAGSPLDSMKQTIRRREAMFMLYSQVNCFRKEMWI